MRRLHKTRTVEDGLQMRVAPKAPADLRHRRADLAGYRRRPADLRHRRADLAGYRRRPAVCATRGKSRIMA